MEAASTRTAPRDLWEPEWAGPITAVAKAEGELKTCRSARGPELRWLRPTKRLPAWATSNRRDTSNRLTEA